MARSQPQDSIDCLAGSGCPAWALEKSAFSALVLWPRKHHFICGKKLTDAGHLECYKAYKLFLKARIKNRIHPDDHILKCKLCSSLYRKEIVFLICWPNNSEERKEIFTRSIYTGWIEFCNIAEKKYMPPFKCAENYANQVVDKLLTELSEALFLESPFQYKESRPFFLRDSLDEKFMNPFAVKSCRVYDVQAEPEKFLHNECFTPKSGCSCERSHFNIITQETSKKQTQGFEQKISCFQRPNETFLMPTLVIRKTAKITASYKAMLTLEKTLRRMMKLEPVCLFTVSEMCIAPPIVKIHKSIYPTENPDEIAEEIESFEPDSNPFLLQPSPEFNMDYDNLNSVKISNVVGNVVNWPEMKAPPSEEINMAAVDDFEFFAFFKDISPIEIDESSANKHSTPPISNDMQKNESSESKFKKSSIKAKHKNRKK